MFKAIPTSFSLPGFRVKIEQLEHEDFIEDFGRCKGAWCDAELTIYLDRSRPIAKRRADLIHEIGHAYLDWQAASLNCRNVNSKG
jgi:hypothetical protein